MAKVHLFLLLIVAVGVVFSTPLPGGHEHLHLKIHVPKSIHTHHHTIVKKIYIPVKEEKHEEQHQYADDAW